MRTLTVLVGAFALLTTAGSSVALVEAVGEVAAFADQSADATAEYAYLAAADAQAKVAAAQAFAAHAAEHPDQAYGLAAAQAIAAADGARARAHAQEASAYATIAYAAQHPTDAVPARPALPEVAAPEVSAPDAVDPITAGPIGTYQWAYGYLDGRVRDAVEDIDSAPGPLTAFAEQLAADAQTKAQAVSELGTFLTANLAGVVNGHVALAASIAANALATAAAVGDLEGPALLQVTMLPQGVVACSSHPDPATAALCTQAHVNAWLNSMVQA